ncbi:hypothetical protein BC938DRAFT_472694 [Jimgerdemannia flammicorona]|uniref:BLOC-1-related complex subunit 6 C-terminal helix domain-containing protein n=1 Tax=Jimgerdemannia flammicorona TaxID=994334 RepID=A0A433Q5K5_9FUNG|nr:hypothetical protein BC938DRAFT_472694 [Jimgerdemannia flammicorona]
MMSDAVEQRQPEGNALSIDQTLLEDLESRALDVSANLDNVLSHLQTQMFEFSRLTLESISVYKLTSDNLTGTLDDCTKRTLELITQCDELDKDFAPLYALAAQIPWTFCSKLCGR